HSPVKKIDTGIFKLNNAGKYVKKVQGLKLKSYDSGLVVFAPTFYGGTAEAVTHEMTSRGYKVASFSYLLSLQKEYGGAEGGPNFLPQALCLEVPWLINFGNG